MICDQCEREFHVGCLKKHHMQTLKELTEGNWFYRSDCDYFHTYLRNLVARKEDHLPKSLLSVIKKKNEKGLEPTFDIRWRVLIKMLIASNDHEARQLLLRVDSIIREQFDPIVDPTSGKDFISAMLEGKSINSQDFRGMYCVVLTFKQEVICAGSFLPSRCLTSSMCKFFGISHAEHSTIVYIYVSDDLHLVYRKAISPIAIIFCIQNL